MRWSAGQNHHQSTDTIYEPMEHDDETAGDSTDYGGSTTDYGSTRAQYPRRLMQPTLKQPRLELECFIVFFCVVIFYKLFMTNYIASRECILLIAVQ